MSSLEFNSYTQKGAARTQTGHGGVRSLPLALIVLPICFLSPVDFSFYIQDFRLDAYRLALLVFFAPALVTLVSSRGFALNLFDLGVFAYGSWIILSLMYHMGVGQGLESGGIIALETVAPYLIARAYLTETSRIERFVRLLIFLSLIIAAVMIVEMMAGRNLVRLFSSSLVGGQNALEEVSGRFGLVRAAGPFAHPIHAGIMAGSLLALHWLLNPNGFKKWLVAVVMGVGVFASVSSGPFLMFLSQVGLLIYNKIMTRLRIPSRWLLLAGIGAAFVVFLQFGSDRGAVLFLVQNLAFNAWTGFYRMLQWEFGMAEVMRNPIWGIGFGDWLRPRWMRMNSSIDAFWLATTMRYGIPATALLGSSVILIWIRLVEKIRLDQDPYLKRLSLAWLVMFFAWCFVGFTVHFWSHTYVFFFLLLGFGAAIVDLKSKNTQPLSVRSNV